MLHREIESMTSRVPFPKSILVFMYYPLGYKETVKSNSFKASFFYRTLQNWNCLPSEVKEITSKNLFKEKLVEHFKKETFRCLIPCSDTMNDSQSAT